MSNDTLHFRNVSTKSEWIWVELSFTREYLVTAYCSIRSILIPIRDSFVSFQNFLYIWYKRGRSSIVRNRVAWSLRGVVNHVFCCRCLRIEWRGSHRIHPREVAVRLGGVLQVPVPQPADQIREAAAASAKFTNCQFGGDRTIVFRETCGENAHRDPDQRHAPFRQLVLVAVYVILETVLGVLVKCRK